MRAVFSSTVAVSLLIHAVMGCCWHQAREAASGDESPVALAADIGCCRHHHAHAPQGQPSHSPCNGKSNCHGLCTYLPPQKTQIDRLQSHVPIDFAAIAPAMIDSQVAALRVMERTRELAPEPPLRLHLLNQILLI